MGACLLLGRGLLAGILADPSLVVRAATLAAIVASGAVLYGAFCQLTGAVNVFTLAKVVRGRR